MSDPNSPVVGEFEADAPCNPGGPCVAYLDAVRIGYLDPKWRDHILAHSRAADPDAPPPTDVREEY
jgi:hypothetical protein